MQAWTANGKIGIRHGDRGNSAQLSWHQQGPEYRIQLNGPLGIGKVLIEGDDTGVSLQNSDGTFTSASPESLVLELTGWDIPVSQLVYWVRGLPAPEPVADEIQLQEGRLQQLSQAGWDIEYQRFTVAHGLSLPSKIVLQRPDTRLTVLIKQWQLPGPSPE